MPLIEDAVNAVYAALYENLHDPLVAAELPTIKRFVFGEKDLEHLDNTPIIYIFGVRSRIQGWRSIQHTAPGWDATHEVDVGIVIENADSDVIRTRLYKYVDIIVTTLIDAYPDSLDQFFPRNEIDIEVSPTLMTSSMFMGDARIKLRLQRVETRG